MSTQILRFVLALVFSIVCLFPDNIQAQSQSGNGDSTSEKAALDLLKVFDEATEIATQSKLNADYVPGMVTVLRGEDLQARGVETVWDALVQVPGFDVTYRGGSKLVSVRGVGGDIGSGNIKFLLNSIPMNSNLTSQALPMLEIPVAQIDRIEIIRGPGSAVHGEFAYVGVVNIVTRKEGSQVYGRAGSFDTFGGGALYSWDDAERDLKISLNVAGTTSDGADVQTGPDTLYGLGLGGISNAPGTSNENKEQFSAGLHLNFKKFSFDAQIAHLASGAAFGIGDALPQPDEKTAFRATDFAMEARQEVDLLPSLQGSIHLGLWQNRFKVNEDYLIFPPGFPGFPNGMVASGQTRERRVFGGTDITWKGWQDHNLLLGWSFAWTELTDAALYANFLPSTGAPLAGVQEFRGSENFIQEGVDRLLNSITLQDEYQATSDLTFTLGLRYDHYDDVGDRLTPRIAGVYRLTGNHILKAQYSQAFRPPNFIEMYSQNNSFVSGNPSINPATIETIDFGYVYREGPTVIRSTLYYSELDDLIVTQGGVFQNSGGAVQMGVELEWEQEIISNLKLNSNLTLMKTEDRATNQNLPGSANLLANVGVNYRPDQDLMFNVQYRYVGPRHRAAGDPRENLAGYNNVDLTANWSRPFGSKGWTLRGGIRNLFNEDIRYAAPANTYPQDYPRPGISFWTQLSFEF